MNIKWEYKIVITYLLLSALFIWWKLKPKPIISGPLPKNDIEQILVDPVKHTITIRTQTSTVTQTLPDRKSVFDIQKDGTVKITASQFGYEVRPYIGLGLSSGVRIYLGADLLYFKRANFGLGVGLPSLGNGNWQVNDIRPLLNLGYNVYSNTSVNFGIDTSKNLHAFLSVRL